jgi:hypothetical protein
MPAAFTDAQRALLLASARVELAELDMELDSAEPRDAGLPALRCRRKRLVSTIWRCDLVDVYRAMVRLGRVS